MTDADTATHKTANGHPVDDGPEGADVARLGTVHRWFSVAWPMSLLFHLIGNNAHLSALFDGTITIVALLQLMVAFLAVLVLLRPRPPYVLILAFLYLIVTYYKAPFIGNHEVILALSALVVLMSVMVSDRHWVSTAAPVLRWLLIMAYGAIAISKLNGSFFDPAVSCAVVFGDELGGHIGIRVSELRSLSLAAIWTTAAVELAIPILLVVRRLRVAGLVLALLFHFVLALEPVGHVFDFTATLFPLFLLFAPDDVQERIADGVDGLAGGRGRIAVAAAAFCVVLLHLAVLITGRPFWIVAYPVWLVVGSTVLWWVFTALSVRLSGEVGWAGDRVRARGPLPILVPVVALLAANAVAPYLQVRTAAAFNMYSNLETVEVDGDHFLGAGLGGARSHELVRIVETPADHPLAFYVDEDRVLPADNLRWYQRNRLLLAPAADELSSDEEVVLEWLVATSDNPPARLSDLDAGTGGWGETLTHKFGFVRAVDLSSPARCLRTWGPAG